MDTPRVISFFIVLTKYFDQVGDFQKTTLSKRVLNEEFNNSSGKENVCETIIGMVSRISSSLYFSFQKTCISSADILTNDKYTIYWRALIKHDTTIDQL